jgi:hypothetical protein
VDDEAAFVLEAGSESRVVLSRDLRELAAQLASRVGFRDFDPGDPSEQGRDDHSLRLCDAPGVSREEPESLARGPPARCSREHGNEPHPDRKERLAYLIDQSACELQVAPRLIRLAQASLQASL